MSYVAIPAHFDGLQIRLDKPVNMEPGTKLIITILPKPPENYKNHASLMESDWTQLAMAGLENAYGENEPEYSLDLIVEANSVIEYYGVQTFRFDGW